MPMKTAEELLGSNTYLYLVEPEGTSSGTRRIVLDEFLAEARREMMRQVRDTATRLLSDKTIEKMMNLIMQETGIQL